jgi:hypothetical protein
MKTIRHNTYETNSSSTHSITIDTKNYKNVQIPKTITIPLGTFGWEYAKFNDFLTKASYFWTLALYNEDVNARMIRLAADHGLDLQFIQSNDEFYAVDHGSEHYDNWVKKNPELLTDEGLWNFLINESCWIVLGNDNSYDPPNWRITEKAAKALEYEVYICSIAADDYVDVSNCSFKTDKGTLMENKEEITSHVHYMLDCERSDRNWDDPFPRFKEISNDGIITINYQKYDHTTKELKVIRTRMLRAVIEKVKKR